ncbi:unnamed protein product [Paramecium sonneborni]|uniref:Uncharacterized protein n=1 Tax=Paramecium sonneborni TaxID=65129 RepID=A0A8S1RTF7_9CILI|nr:unnamed protein product [Paramecium sonneborni]
MINVDIRIKVKKLIVKVQLYINPTQKFCCVLIRRKFNNFIQRKNNRIQHNQYFDYQQLNILELIFKSCNYTLKSYKTLEYNQIDNEKDLFKQLYSKVLFRWLISFIIDSLHQCFQVFSNFGPFLKIDKCEK